MSYVSTRRRRRVRPGALGFSISFEAEAEASTSGGVTASATTTTGGGAAAAAAKAAGAAAGGQAVDPAVLIAAGPLVQYKLPCGPATYTVRAGDNTISVVERFWGKADTLAHASELIRCNNTRRPGPKGAFAALVPGEKLTLPKSWPALKPPSLVGPKKPVPPVMRTGFVKTRFTLPAARPAAEPGMSSGKKALLFAGLLAAFGGGMVLLAKRKKKAKK